MSAPTAGAVIASLPYFIEGVDLLTKYVMTLTADDIDESDLEAMEQLKARFETSAQNADSALDALREAIATKRAQQGGA